MKNKIQTILVIITVLSCFSANVVSADEKEIANAPNPVKWEYKITNLMSDFPEPSTQEVRMNRLGELGWELVAVTNEDNVNPLYIFKRAKE